MLSLRGIDVYTPKEVFRIAGLEGLISQSENWFEYVDKRKIFLLYQYEKKILQTVYPILTNFLKDLDSLIINLKKL